MCYLKIVPYQIMLMYFFMMFFASLKKGSIKGGNMIDIWEHYLGTQPQLKSCKSFFQVMKMNM